MFAAISPQYDLANRLLSLGVDVRWRRQLARRAAPAVPGPILDVCCGTGDLTAALARVLPGRRVMGVDFCRPMLDIACSKLVRLGLEGRVQIVESDALALPFADGVFSLCAAAFGIRNVADLGGGVHEMARVTRPGGTVAVLEFARPSGRMLGALYRAYLGGVVPLLGGLIAGNGTDAYRYLRDSVRAFAEPDVMLAHMARAGIAGAAVRPLTGGIAALYAGVKG